MLLLLLLLLSATAQQAEVSLQLQQCKVECISHFSAICILTKLQLKLMNVGCYLLKIYKHAYKNLHMLLQLIYVPIMPTNTE